MSNRMKEAFLSIAVLVALATASGMLLGFLNKLTSTDSPTYQNEVLQKFDSIYSSKNGYEMISENQGNVKYFAVSKDSDKTYAFYSKGKGGYNGDVYMYVFIKDNKIVSLTYGENSETFLHKIDNAHFIENFLDKDLDSQYMPDSVSGATGSSTAIKAAVSSAVELYKSHIDAEVKL